MRNAPTVAAIKAVAQNALRIRSIEIARLSDAQGVYLNTYALHRSYITQSARTILAIKGAQDNALRIRSIEIATISGAIIIRMPGALASIIEAVSIIKIQKGPLIEGLLNNPKESGAKRRLMIYSIS